jgi:predicted aspartyl protease
MGRIVTSVTIHNPFDKSKSLRCDALVDTGASHMVLPAAWKGRLGDMPLLETVEVETATQAVEQGEVRGPVIIQVEGFRAVANEVLFIEMEPEDGIYEPLIGYLVLEQCQAAVDMLGHRLVHVKHLDLK